MAASAMAFEVAGGMDSKWMVAVQKRTCGRFWSIVGDPVMPFTYVTSITTSESLRPDRRKPIA
jgi:hypothetical protein